MALKDSEVTVLGAGVAGLALARALALKGADVTVLEQADAIREVGAGLQISPNGANVLRALGLEEGLLAVSDPGERVQVIDGPGGGVLTELDLAAHNRSARMVHRADLIDVLYKGALAAGARVQLLQQIETVDLSGPRPRVVTALGAERVTDLLIGADGLHSKVRAGLNGSVAPFFTRQVAWRALIPCEAGAPAVAEIHVGPGRHLVSYPLRGGRLRNIVAVEERHRWVEESWNLRDDPMELRLAFAGFAPRVRDWLEQIEDVWLWGLFRHPVAKHWHGKGAAILGDAAHPMLPFLAQGANMALEDAYVLAEQLSRNGKDGLPAYQAARAARCARVVAASNTNARAYHLRDPLRALAHLGLRATGKLVPGTMLRRFDWIYTHDVTRP